ncbi:MAG: bifunctional phosphoglucose/phosphomannose isomerase [Methanobacteriota archaeon]
MLEPETIARVDRGGMRDLVASLPEHLAEGLQRALGTPAELKGAQRIFLAGMGGSGIAADIFAAWVAGRSRVPLRVVRDYTLPPSARKGDVLVSISYSGDTEETLAATAHGLKLGCKLIAVTSGGALRRLATEAGAEVLEVPKGLPPRGAFGHLFGVLPGIAEDWVYGDLGGELAHAIVHLKALRAKIAPDVPFRRNRAKLLAFRLKGRVPVVYGAGPLAAVAVRWQTQLNENAKVLAFSSELPEADHNELVGWCEDPTAKRFVPVLLREAGESDAMRVRLDATAELMSKATRVEQVVEGDEEPLGRMLGLLFLGDYVSVYLAALRGVDPLPVKSIEELKARLARPERS